MAPRLQGLRVESVNPKKVETIHAIKNISFHVFWKASLVQYRRKRKPMLPEEYEACSLEIVEKMAA